MKKNKENEILCSENEQKEWDIIDALDFIQENAHMSRLDEDFHRECEDALGYICKRLEISEMQAILIAIMSELGDTCTWRRIGDFLGLSRLKVMAYTSEIEGLMDRRWVTQYGAYENGGFYEGFKLAYGIIRAFRHNENFVPETIEGLSEQIYVSRITRYMCNEGGDHRVSCDENLRWLIQLTNANLHLPVCRAIMELSNDASRMLFFLVIADYAQYYGTDCEGVRLQDLSQWFDKGNWEFDRLADDLREGKHELLHRELIEFGCDDGIVDNELFKLTLKSRDILLSNYIPQQKKNRRLKNGDRELVSYKTIQSKNLFYNPAEKTQLDRLKSLLDQKGLKNVQDRLEECGLRKGVACLFYGAPGTGKTETVLQLARSTGRDVFQVNIAGIRDKFVGESEKNIKSLFNRYRELCQNCEVMPILLFNEADALINNRFDTTRNSVEKMDNAIQNIILQEIESLSGILIATTNLTSTLDPAFERRFLYKIEFAKPGIEVKKSIWQNMLPWLNEQDCQLIAREFDFSGGEIENIARKCNIEYAFSGAKASISQIREFCNTEALNRNNRIKVGF